MSRSLARAALALGLLLGAAGCGSATAPVEPPSPLYRAGGTVLVEVAESRVPCVGVGPMECLRVRDRADGEWQLFYDHFEGFTYEPGYRYRLRVAVREVPDPPADGSSLAWRLIELVSKTPAP